MKDETDITIVLDRSGSMVAIQDDTIGGYNRFLEDQKALDMPAKLSLVLFDHEYTPAYLGIDLKDAPPLNRVTFAPRGSTALLDAVGRTIEATGARLRALSEENRPGRVLFVIITDGLENCSREYTRAMIRERVEHQSKKYGWTFVYLGANQDAFSEAGEIGIARQYAGNYKATTQGLAANYSTISSNVGAMRGGIAPQNLCWDPSAAGAIGSPVGGAIGSPDDPVEK